MTRQGQRQGLPAAPARAPPPGPARLLLQLLRGRTGGRAWGHAGAGRLRPLAACSNPALLAQRQARKSKWGPRRGGAVNGGGTRSFPIGLRSRRATCRAQAAGLGRSSARPGAGEGKKNREDRKRKKPTDNRKNERQKKETVKLCLDLKQQGDTDQNSPGFWGNCGALAAAAAPRRGCPGPAPRCPAGAHGRAAPCLPFRPRTAPAERLAAMGLGLCNI